MARVAMMVARISQIAQASGGKRHFLARRSATQEGGAPEDLVQSFHDLFSEKIDATKQFARQAAERYGFLPHILRDT